MIGKLTATEQHGFSMVGESEHHILRKTFVQRGDPPLNITKTQREPGICLEKNKLGQVALLWLRETAYLWVHMFWVLLTATCPYLLSNKKHYEKDICIYVQKSYFCMYIWIRAVQSWQCKIHRQADSLVQVFVRNEHCVHIRAHSLYSAVAPCTGYIHKSSWILT